MEPQPFEILIVDDDPENAALLSLLLKNRGYGITVAGSGEEALERVGQVTPDLVLLDIMLPGMNGLEVCRRMKAAPATAKTPILFLTAVDSREERIAGFRAGAEDYITKPFFKEEVLARVRLRAERAEAVKTMQILQKNLIETNQQLEQRVRDRTADLEQAHQKMVIQEKMASMGKLSAGLAHELNNPINFLRTNFAALETSLADLRPLIDLYRRQNMSTDSDEALRADILAREEAVCLDFMLDDLDNLFTESREGFERISWLISSMRGFARQSNEHESSMVDLDRCIRETLILVRNEAKRAADITFIAGKVPTVPGHAQKLKQVILNLITNALQAVDRSDETRGAIRIETGEAEGGILMTVTDNGPGIRSEIRDRIFDPFFTTKEVGQGIGLGLSLCYDIVVQQHGGTIEASSEACPGASFRVFLPDDRR